MGAPTSTVVFVGSGSVGRPKEMPHGRPSMIGITFTRISLRWGIQRTSRSPRDSTTTLLCAPHETAGTIGTPVRRASLIQPVRPAKSMW